MELQNASLLFPQIIAQKKWLSRNLLALGWNLCCRCEAPFVLCKEKKYRASSILWLQMLTLEMETYLFGSKVNPDVSQTSRAAFLPAWSVTSHLSLLPNWNLKIPALGTMTRNLQCVIKMSRVLHPQKGFPRSWMCKATEFYLDSFYVQSVCSKHTQRQISVLTLYFVCKNFGPVVSSCDLRSWEV